MNTRLVKRFNKTDIKNFHGDVSSMKLIDMIPDMLIAIGRACRWSAFTSKYYFNGANHLAFCNYEITYYERDGKLFVYILDLKKYKPTQNLKQQKAKENILNMLLDINKYMTLCPRVKAISRPCDHVIKIIYQEPVKIVEEKMLLKSPLEHDRIVKTSLNETIKTYDKAIAELNQTISSAEEKLDDYIKRQKQLIADLFDEKAALIQKIDVLNKAKEVLGFTR